MNRIFSAHGEGGRNFLRTLFVQAAHVVLVRRPRSRAQRSDPFRPQASHPW